MNRDKRTGVLVQMRLDSTRLPGKALLPLGNSTMAGIVMRRLRGIGSDEYILATDDAGAAALAGMARDEGFSVFAGPKNDVLARFMMAADAFGLERIVRATGDNPFVSVKLAEIALDAARETDSEYTALTGMPVGMGVEVVSVAALRRAAEAAREARYREHVCPYLYEHPELFTVARVPCPPDYRLPDASVTVDTASDYDRAVAIVAAFGPVPADADVFSWLRASVASGASA